VGRRLKDPRTLFAIGFLKLANVTVAHRGPAIMPVVVQLETECILVGLLFSL
jgi:Fe2+ transport system protein FeoA